MNILAWSSNQKTTDTQNQTHPSTMHMPFIDNSAPLNFMEVTASDYQGSVLHRALATLVIHP